MIDRFRKFITESRQELRHVNWPSRSEAMRLTSVVVGMALGLAVFLGIFDYLFLAFIKSLLPH